MKKNIIYHPSSERKKTTTISQRELKHAWSLNHPLVKGNPLKAAILETVVDFAFLSLIADLFKKR